MNDTIERIEDNNHLISMTPLEKIIEMGYALGFNENTKVLDLCCGYGTMLKVLNQVYKIKGKGMDLSKEFIDIGNERLKKAGILNDIVLECNDINNCKETGYDAIILTETYHYGSIENSLKELDKFIKPDGKKVIGLLTSPEEEIPQGLKDFDQVNLYTEMEVYDILMKNGYAISYIARSTQSQWDRYFTWDSKRTVANIRNSKTAEEKEKAEQWLQKWYTMYAKYRIKYEQWCLYAVEKI
ncbi:MAG: class I SAM-dependent methyltransferase [Treponema sp.]|jgi:cyclopropane fatty-acyl-phospholipid synthase-like methyltransferase|nr:class I SAM-dependent methyltransferase [Treponema sp.]